MIREVGRLASKTFFFLPKIFLINFFISDSLFFNFYIFAFHFCNNSTKSLPLPPPSLYHNIFCPNIYYLFAVCLLLFYYLIPVDGVIEDNMAKFLEDLDVREDDLMSMVIPWKFGAKVLGVFTEEEFVKGMANLGYVLQPFRIDHHIFFVIQ